MRMGTSQLSPLYDNSSSLCAYISENRWNDYLGRDQVLWKSLVDTKSKSLIRINEFDKKSPTHLEMMEHLRNVYYTETISVVEKIITHITEEKIIEILNEYNNSLLPEKKKQIIIKFLLAKVERLTSLYLGKEG